jgi:Zn-dependent peptidase ImmA (M78 family)/transcriptional regulator with XRE-family HTH domain
MTQGTPGFIGERLREAREAQNLSQADVARLIDTTRQAVSGYEAGSITPAPNVTRNLAEALGVLPSFFQRRRPLGTTFPPSSATFFRSRARAKEGERRKGAFREDLAMELLAYALETVDLPLHNLPELGLSAKPAFFDRSYIEAVATRLREGWGVGLGPIQNVVWLLEHQGVIVLRDDVATSDIDAFSTWRGDFPVMMLSSAKGSAVRSRWDAAHELAHLILHRHIDRSQVEDREGLKLLETQADWFAGAFLLPAEIYRRSIIIPSLDEFLKVKPLWKVSIQAQLERCFALRLVSEQARSRMWRDMSVRGWRFREPLDDELELEQPEILRKSIEMGIEDGDLDLESLGSEVGFSSEKVQGLLKLRPVSARANRVPDNLLVFPPSRGGRVEA